MDAFADEPRDHESPFETADVARERSFVFTALVSLWGIFFAFLLTSAGAGVDDSAQLWLAGTILFFLLTFRDRCQNGIWRLFYVFCLVFIMARYFFWRTTETLTYYDVFSFVGALLLYGAEVLSLVIGLLGVLVSIRPVDRPFIPLPQDESELPTVDVFIPTYNEDVDLLENTMIAATELRYPPDKIEVHLLDDGGTTQKLSDPDPAKAEAAAERAARIKAICREFGIAYHTRERNEHAKSGNMNAALKNTHGDLVLVLDADHIPTADLLEKTVGQFVADDRLFMVQTPHFFINADPIERNLDLFGKMPGESEMFFRIIQRGLDFWNATLFAGSAAILRRKALEETDGFAQETVTEDAETALELHARGWRSAFVSRPMVAGLAPETFSGFVVQRMRWAQGMVQILLLKKPLTRPGLTMWQRLCYFSNCLYWFFPYARLIFLLAPTAYLFFGLKIYDANVQEIFVYVLPQFWAAMALSAFLFGKLRWPFVSMLYELLQSMYSIATVTAVLRNPRAPSFKVTPKGEHLEDDFVSPLAWPFYIVLGVLALGYVFAGYWWQAQPDFRHVLVIGLMWHTLNALLMLAALGSLVERKQRRIDPRMPAIMEGTLETDRGGVPVKITDLSAGGCRLEADIGWRGLDEVHPNTDGGRLALRAHEPGLGLSTPLPLKIANRRVWEDKVVVGCQFQPRSAQERRDIVALVFGDSERWQRYWDRELKKPAMGTTRGLVVLAWRGLTHSRQHITYAVRELAHLAWRGGKLVFARAAAPVEALALRMAAAEDGRAVAGGARRSVPAPAPIAVPSRIPAHAPSPRATFTPETGVDSGASGTPVPVPATEPETAPPPAVEEKRPEPMLAAVTASSDRSVSEADTPLDPAYGLPTSDTAPQRRRRLDTDERPGKRRPWHLSRLRRIRFFVIPLAVALVLWPSDVSAQDDAADPLRLTPPTDRETGLTAGRLGDREFPSVTYRRPLMELMPVPEPIRLQNDRADEDIFIPISTRFDIDESSVRLDFTNSIALLGERSQLRTLMNGAVVAQVPLEGAQPDVELEAFIDPELLVPGFNRLRFEVAQHYTLECEDPGAPELWTQIDTRNSSITLSGQLRPLSPVLSELDDLITPGLGSPNRFTLVTPGALREQDLATGALLAQGVALRLQFLPAVFDHLGAVPAPNDDPDVDPRHPLSGLYQPSLADTDAFVVGTRDALDAYLNPSQASAITGPFIGVYPRADDPRYMIVLVSGQTDADVREAASVFSLPDFPFADAAASLVSLEDAPPRLNFGRSHRVSPGAAYEWNDLGYGTTSMKGSNPQSVGVQFDLPPDFYVSEDAQVRLSLNFAYGANLRGDSVINIYLNERFERAIPLNNPNGAVLRDYDVFIPMRSFDRGENRMEAEAVMVPSVNQDCVTAQSGNLLLTLFDTTWLEFPPAASYAEMPDLGLFASTGFPFLQLREGMPQPTVSVTSLDSRVASAAWTLSGKLAQINDAPLTDMDFVVGVPDEAANVLVVGPLPAIDEDLLAGSALARTDGSLQVPYPVSDTDRRLSDFERLREQLQVVAGRRDGERERPLQAQVRQSALPQRYGVAMGYERPGQQGLKTILFTALDEPRVKARMEELVSPGLWGQLRGDVALWRGDIEEVATQEANERFYIGSLGVPDFLRYHLSAQPVYWVIGVLVAILILAFVTQRLLVRLGRRIHRRRALDDVRASQE